jgi:hypothetical protein
MPWPLKRLHRRESTLYFDLRQITFFGKADQQFLSLLPHRPAMRIGKPRLLSPTCSRIAQREAPFGLDNELATPF